jgi:TetR/AcrR family transcriptional repressor of nem operon
MVLGALEGALLITRLDGDVARFTATVDQLLSGLAPTRA